MTEKPQPDFSRDDLFDAISQMLSADGAEDSENYLTTNEIVAALRNGNPRINGDKVRAILRRLDDDGRLITRQVVRPALGGQHRARPAYAIRPKSGT